MSAVGTEIRACDFSRYPVAFFHFAQAVHPDAVLNLMPPRILLVRDSKRIRS
jgi:hypothetical protein